MESHLCPLGMTSEEGESNKGIIGVADRETMIKMASKGTKESK